MLLKLKKIFATDLVKVSFLNGIATMIRMITGLISSKVVAVLLGPSGMALLGQLNNFSMIILSISSGGINNGMTKHIAQYSDSEKRYSIFLTAGFRITTTISLICGLVVIIGAGYFSRIILKTDEYTPVFYIFGTTIILYALNALLLSVINGFREFKKYVTINITSSISGLLFAIALTLSFGVYGALISLVTYQSVVFAITLYLASQSSWFKWSLFFGKFSWTVSKKLGNYAIMALVSAVAIPLSQLIIRNYITRHETIENAGLWESMNKISSMYLMVITTSLSVYYLPRLAGLKNNNMAIRSEVFQVYKLLIPFLVFISFTIFLTRHFVINLLFDDKFSGMENLFAFQLLGDVLKMSTWVLGYILVAKAMTRTYIIVEIVSCTLFVLLSILFVNLYGTIGATIGYAAAFLCQLLIMIFIFRKLLLHGK